MRLLSKRLLFSWPTCARIAVGYFFLISAYMKWSEGFFFLRTSPLQNDWQYWLSRGWTLPMYRPVLTFLMPYADIVAGLVIFLHAAVAILLLTNKHVRLAGFLLLFVQMNIFFATCLGWGFLLMVGSSLWIALYFIVKRPLTIRAWNWLTLLFLFIYFLMILGRYQRGDPWLTEFPLQFAHFQEEVMGAHPFFKHLVLRLSASALAPWMWASVWWLHAILFCLLFTRYRLIIGILVGILFVCRSILWMNVMGAEAVVYMLLLFVWISEEACMQARHGVQPLFSREQFSYLKMYRHWVFLPIRRVVASMTVITKKRTSIGWPLFFAFFTSAMMIFLVVPAVFGLQNFNQWGGMYDEHWCYVEMYSGDPKSTISTPNHEQQSAGYTGTSRVFSGPMNNEMTCLMWARSRCGKKSTNGWTVVWALPSLKGHKFTNDQNACDLSLPVSSPWFRYDRT